MPNSGFNYRSNQLVDRSPVYLSKADGEPAFTDPAGSVGLLQVAVLIRGVRNPKRVIVTRMLKPALHTLSRIRRNLKQQIVGMDQAQGYRNTPSETTALDGK